VAIDHSRVHRAIGRRMQRIDELDYRMRDALRASVEQRKRALNALATRLAQRDVRLRLSQSRARLETLGTAAFQRVRLRLSQARAVLAPLQAHLGQLSPLKILDRGYAIVERDGHIVKTPAEAPAGSKLRVRLARGEIAAQVVKK
jgi:exodeoxyribonuclease VII large subunit